MKLQNKMILGLLALSAAATSCTSDEPVNTVATDDAFGTEAITLDSYLGRTTNSRADITNLAGLQAAGSGFAVYAYYTGTTAWASYASDSKVTPNFMNQQHVTYASAGWSYSPLKYWPKNSSDLISFFAYAPATSSNIKEAASGVISYTAAENFDLVAANQIDKNTPKTAVKFQFAHTTSRLAINVKTDKTYDEATAIKVTSVTINGNKYYTEGSYSLFNLAWATMASPLGTTSTKTVSAAAGYTLSTTAQSAIDGTYLFLIPSVQASGTASDKNYATGDFQITVNYTVTTTDSNLAAGSVSTSHTYTAQLGKELQASKAYTLTFTLGLDAIEFDADVTDWTAETVVPGVTI